MNTKDFADQLNSVLAETRYWEIQAEQQIASDSQQQRAEADKAKQAAVSAAAQRRKAAIDAAVKERDAALASITKRRDEELAAALAAFETTLKPLPTELESLIRSSGYAAAPWSDPKWSNWRPSAVYEAAPLRIGKLVVKGHSNNLTIPALLPVIGHASVLFRATDAAKAGAAQAVQGIAARLLAIVPPAKLRFAFIDPVGLGQNVAAFMHLADHDEVLVGSRAWSEPQHIEQQLAGLTEHMENVIQKYLRSQYQSIEDYNAKAGEVAEPYRLLLVFDFPTNFSETSARRLVSIAQNGPRCGVYTLVMVDASKPLPYGFRLEDLAQNATVIALDGSAWRWEDPVLRAGELVLDPGPPTEITDRIVKTIGQGAKAANTVRVPFERIMPPRNKRWIGFVDEEGHASGTAERLRVRLGPVGASKFQIMELGGAGTNQHALVVGRTGSGKSVLLHTIIMNLALTYSPEEMQLYLVDFKQGVEFQAYARYQLPHARVVAIESEREFGLSVLQGLRAEIDRRARLFVADGAATASLNAYRAKTGEILPRILLIVDEFQVFFNDNDAIGRQAMQLLDDLVRQGRSYGIHVLLASQTLSSSNAFALPSTITNQMAVRIALQCSESDSVLILANDNLAARSLERPGQAIYNNAAGNIEGNSQFQVAILEEPQRFELLKELQSFARQQLGDYSPPLVFEGNKPADLAKNSALCDLLTRRSAPPKAPVIWLGEPVAIRELVTVSFPRQSGANLLIIGQDEESATGLVSAALLALASQVTPVAAMSINLLDFSMNEGETSDVYARMCPLLRQPITIGKRRHMASILTQLADEVKRRLDEDNLLAPRSFLIIHGIQRARELRYENVYSAAGHDLDQPLVAKPAEQFASILRDGPEVGVHTIVWCDTMNSLERTLERSSTVEFALRVGLQMSPNDSTAILQAEVASKLGPYRAYLLDEDRNRLEKFRPYGTPDLEWLKKQRT